MEVLVELGDVVPQETPVHRDRIPAQRGLSGRYVLPDEVEGGLACRLDGHGRLLDQREQARAGVHAPDDFVHVSQLLFGRVDDEIGTFGHDGEIVVRHEGGHLDDHVAVRVEAGHLKIHPYEHGRIVTIPQLRCETWPRSLSSD